MVNTFIEFPPDLFDKMMTKVWQATTESRQCILHCIDGAASLCDLQREPEGKLEEGEESITYRFQGYDPVESAWTTAYHNSGRREDYLGKMYLYTLPMVRLQLRERFHLENSHRLGENSFFLDIFRRI